MTKPRLNTSDPAQLEAAADSLQPGKAPELGIIIAARQERLRGGLSTETVDVLELYWSAKGGASKRRRAAGLRTRRSRSDQKIYYCRFLT
jgi:hypothetical protein